MTDRPTRPEEITLVVAVAENGVIGADGAVPWHYPEDLGRFKETTMGHPVIMGRRTFESIHERLGEPLPGRLNIVLSRSDPDLPPEVQRARDIESALGIAGEADPNLGFVIGGQTVYEQFLPRADRMVWTEIHDTYEGDTRFPTVDWEEWTEIEREDREDLSFVVYERQ